MTKRLVLVGGGHAHLEVLRQCATNDRPHAVEVILVSPVSLQVYTGMVPGYLHGAYTADAITFDLPALCRAAGVRYIECSADCVSGTGRYLETGGKRIEFDVASLDVGSVAAGGDDSGITTCAAFVRPFPKLLALNAHISTLIGGSSGDVPVMTIVGAGAAGVEVALAVKARMTAARRTAIVTLMDEASDVLPRSPAPLCRRAREILDASGVQVVTGERVAAVSDRTIRLGDGTRIESDLTVWLTGAAPPPILARSDLPLDVNGFFMVDEHLRSADGSPVWGAGDCVTLMDAPSTPKAGVYAVREGPVLAKNLWAAIQSTPLTAYIPQADFLVVLDTADGKGLLRWRGIISHSHWALWLKHWIDRRFMNRYRGLTATN